jgi:hypothetical protein
VESDLTEVLVKDGILNGLVGWWKFDEASGTVAYDSSGNGNDGNLTNGPTWTNGKIGGALNFANANAFVNCGKGESLDLSGKATISSWIMANTGAPNGGILGKRGAYAIYWDADYESFPGGGVQSIIASSNYVEWGHGANTFASNIWFHILYLLEDSKEMFFINGNLVKESNIERSIPSSNLDFIIGKLDSYERFNGLIDDVRIYDRALSAEEVQALYNLEQ